MIWKVEYLLVEILDEPNCPRFYHLLLRQFMQIYLFQTHSRSFAFSFYIMSSPRQNGIPKNKKGKRKKRISRNAVHEIVLSGGEFNTPGFCHFCVRQFISVYGSSFLCTAVHVINSFSASFSLLCFLFVCIRPSPCKAGWDANKYIEKEMKREKQRR